MVFRCFVGCLVWALATVLSQPLCAAEIQPFSGKDGVVEIIAIYGELLPGDEKTFANIALQTQSSLVILNSQGGSLSAALGIGKAIRVKGFRTYVPDHGVCASACGLIWLAGTAKALSTTARVGFHAAYREEYGVKSVTSSGNALVGAYLNSLGCRTLPCLISRWRLLTGFFG